MEGKVDREQIEIIADFNSMLWDEVNIENKYCKQTIKYIIVISLTALQ